ncbi:hypothetical protein [Actinomadura chokoriensis]|uniref:Uncharacterized protein n=1 Tax=Actinomadura chokoriensis TaxID=454156 RepID=A0ABV4QR73_9ACTN
MNYQTIVSACAILIAVLSLAVSIFEARAARAHNRYSVKPMLQLRHVAKYGSSEAGVKIANIGLGPAVIDETIVKLDGNHLGEWNLDTYHAIFDQFPIQPQVSTLFHGGLIPAGHQYFLVRIEDFDEKEHAWFWELVTNRLYIEVRYKSLYRDEELCVGRGGGFPQIFAT